MIKHPRKHSFFTKTALSLGIAAIMQPALVSAQEAEEGNGVSEEVIVTGIRQTLRESIDIKREATTIVDALSSKDIGALPDNSIAEALERVTGVAGDRFKGNASEISIRGMGPFLGSSTVNGRPISSGSGSRAVAFAQFPSELVNGAVVYKAQQADIREGGVSGTIDIQTIKPLEYGKRRISIDVRANYNPYHDDIRGNTGWGQRGAISFVDVFETDIGDFGFAIGYAGGDTSTPEQSFLTSRTFRDCDQDRTATVPSPDSNNSRNCDDNRVTTFDPNGGYDSTTNENVFYDDSVGFGSTDGQGDGFYLVPNLSYWRAMESEEERDAWLTAFQWQPNEKWDINLDWQYSDREYFEDRHDLYIDDGRRNIEAVRATDEGALLSYRGNSRISSYGQFRVRGEKYQGGGLNIKYSPTDAMTFTFDAASTDTQRKQSDIFARFRSGRRDYQLDFRGSERFPVLTILSQTGPDGSIAVDPADPATRALNPANPEFYVGGSGADIEGRDEDFLISDEIISYGLDGAFEIDSIVNKVTVGVDYSRHEFIDFNEDRIQYQDADQVVNAADFSFCTRDFIDNDYGQDGGAIITNAGFENQWWNFDTQCAVSFIRFNDPNGARESNPAAPKPENIDLTETVTAAFAMAEFATEFGNVEVGGNVGVRFVNTEIESDAIRQPYTVSEIDDGNGNTFFEVVNDEAAPAVVTTLENDFSNVLPSLNLTFTFSEAIQLRAAVYRALSRPDMWYMGSGRELDEADDDAVNGMFSEADAIAFAQNNIEARGNPFLEALESTNYDLSASYFFNDDTALSVALYSKQFDATYRAQSRVESYLIDDDSVNFTVSGLPTIIDESSTINGLEVSFQSVFSMLPEPFDGLGTALSYNFSDSDFETPENGTEINAPIRSLIEPSNLIGLSEHVFSGQLYWENDIVTARLAYVYRSEYLKPFDNDLGQTNRIVDDRGTWDFDISYEIIDNLSLRFQALNFTNEPYVEQSVVRNAFSRIEYSGPRYFFGVKYSIF